MALSIAVIVAVLVAWILIPLLSALDRRRPRRVGRPIASWTKRLEPWLAGIPLPTWFVRWRSRSQLWVKLQRAGVPWSNHGYQAFEWAVAWLGLGLAGLTSWVLRGFPGRLLAMMVVAVALVAPSAWLRIRSDRRRLAVERQLPDFLDRLTLALSAGLGFEVAMRRTTASLKGLLGDEMRRCVRYLDWGRTKSEAMAQLAMRNPSRDVHAFVTSVRQAETLGSSLAATLQVQRDLIRARRRRRVQEASRRLPVLIVFPLVLFFLPALLIIFLAPPLLHLFLGR
jgi:Flp pilus assembly protein TadB